MSRIILTFDAIFVVNNQVKAGKLGVVQALLQALDLHKANAEVARPVVGALSHICGNGINLRYSSMVSICVIVR